MLQNFLYLWKRTPYELDKLFLHVLRTLKNTLNTLNAALVIHLIMKCKFIRKRAVKRRLSAFSRYNDILRNFPTI